MADINRPPPATGVAWNGGGNRQQQGGRRGFRQAVEAYGHAPLPEPHDTLSIHGIPPREFTDSVQRTIEDLVAEIERLRWALEQSEGRQAYLEGLADRDPLLPVLNRRAFERELGRLMQAVEPEAGAPAPVLALFYLENFEGLHGELGLDAAETALRHVAETLLTHVRQSDVVGMAGGAGIGIVLTLASEDAVRRKVRELAEAITAWPPRHTTGALPLSLRWAVQPLRRDVGVAQALALVDSRLREGLDDAVGA